MVDLHPLRASDPIFDLQTQALGRLVIENLIVKHMVTIEKALAERNDTSALDLIDVFLKSLARTENGDCLTREQIQSISLNEKEDFAEQLLNAATYMYHKPIQRTNDLDLDAATNHKRIGEITIERDKNESAIDYFYRVYLDYMRDF
jgi:hypothetical protein